MTLRDTKPSPALTAPRKSDRGITIRHCKGLQEFEACLRVERDVWNSSDIDVVPIPLFVVASHTGGQVLGAFDGPDLVGFTMAIAGWRDRKPFLHSHMTAVLEPYRDRGVGRQLKLFQRNDALVRGISLVEWTFDPLVTKNAHFNFMRLGAVARRYLPNVYGITTSPLHGSMPTDRLVAEWHLRSLRVRRVLEGKDPAPKLSEKAVRITVPLNFEKLRSQASPRAAKVQAGVRSEFLKWFGKGYITTAVAAKSDSFEYILERGK